MERQRIWLSLSLMMLGMFGVYQDESYARTTDNRSRAIRPATLIKDHRVSQPPVQPQVEIRCPELPGQYCGIVSEKRNRCFEFWFVKTEVQSLDSCTKLVAEDQNFSAYITCGRMYRNRDQFGELSYTRQFGNIPISKGSCTPMAAFPMCTQLSAIPAGSYCRCPAGSSTAVAGCDPNEANNSCLSTSIAHQCG